MNSLARKIYDLRVKGHSVDSIAQICGIKASTVRRNIERITILKHDDHRAEILRTRELEKLDQLDQTFMPFALEGSLDAAKMVLSTVSVRSKIAGLEAPKEVNNNVRLSLVDALKSLPPVSEKPMEQEQQVQMREVVVIEGEWVDE